MSCTSQYRGRPLHDKPYFDYLFSSYYAALTRFALKITGNFEIARDIVQDLFVDLFEKKDQQILRPETVKSYLYRATQNRCLNYLKHENVKRQYNSSYLSESKIEERNLAEQIANVETEERIYKAISDLPEKCRLVFEKSRFEGKKNSDIAGELGLSIKTVENQISNALKLLRIKLNDLL